MSVWICPDNVCCLAGVDEVGRGALAGDVIAAAVILPVNHSIEGLMDSKRLSANRRKSLYREIIDVGGNFAIGHSSAREIDGKNILRATLTAMRRAVDALAIRPDYVVVDGNHLPSWTYRSEAIVGGDNLVPQISAASVIAKVTRDHHMILYDSLYPGYDFISNKGYGTATHIEALSALGPTPIHRFSFAPLKDKIEV